MPLLKAQLAKCQEHYQKLMIQEYDRGLTDGKTMALPSTGTEEYRKLIKEFTEYLYTEKGFITKWAETNENLKSWWYPKAEKVVIKVLAIIRKGE